MKRPTELTDWDFPNTISVPDGYDITQEPDLTRANFNKLIEEHNNLVEVVNLLVDRLNSRGLPIEFDDNDDTKNI